MLNLIRTTFRRTINLIVYIGDVHHEVDIITEVIRHDSAKDVLRDVVPGHKRFSLARVFRPRQSLPRVAHMRSIVYGRAAVVPFNAPSFTWNELVLETKTCGGWALSHALYLNARTLVLVNVLYNFSTGSAV